MWSGIPVVSAPAIEREHALVHGGTALVLVSLPILAGAAVEARLLLRAARGRPSRWIVGSLAVLAGCAFLGAVATSPWVLAAALACAAPASGCACALAEGALVAGTRHAADRVLVRWTLAGAAGDLTAPLLAAAVARLGLGWRAALWAVGALVLVQAIVCARGGAATAALDREESIRAPRALLRNRTLLAWLAGCAACTLLDETLVALAALHLRQDLGATETATALALAAWAAGSTLGLLLSDALLARAAPRRLLIGSALLCIAVCCSWLVATSVAAVTLALFVLGAAGAPLYPIAQARAFAACAHHPALVGAAAQLFAPLEVGLPWLAGTLADVATLPVALAALALQPAALLALAMHRWPRR